MKDWLTYDPTTDPKAYVVFFVMFVVFVAVGFVVHMIRKGGGDS